MGSLSIVMNGRSGGRKRGDLVLVLWWSDPRLSYATTWDSSRTIRCTYDHASLRGIIWRKEGNRSSNPPPSLSFPSSRSDESVVESAVVQ